MTDLKLTNISRGFADVMTNEGKHLGSVRRISIPRELQLPGPSERVEIIEETGWEVRRPWDAATVTGPGTFGFFPSRAAAVAHLRELAIG